MDLARHLPLVYGAYALVSAGLTVWLARVLSRNGQVFLEEVFPQRKDLATAVNQLLVVGFYLVNAGYALTQLPGGAAPDARTAIETLSGKLGSLLLTLAVMHFANLAVFHVMRKRSLARVAPPPIHAHAFVSPMGA